MAVQSLNNNSSEALTAGSTYTGTVESSIGFETIVVSMKTDQAGTLYVDFSMDGGINWDSTVTYSVAAGTNEIHRLVNGRLYFRVRYTNTSASNQTYFRLGTVIGNHPMLTSNLNSTIQSDADAMTVRSIDPELAISKGLFQDYSLVMKSGRNLDIDTGTVPEDVWGVGGSYAGFPTGAPEEFQVVSSNVGDTGVITFTYLPTIDSTAYLTATATLNGTTPVNTGVTGYRLHTASYSSGSATTFNLGTITVRHRTTTANVFCQIPIGISQTNESAYTIPAGSTGFIHRLFCMVSGSTTGIVNGSLWVRGNGGSPRLRRPFSSGNGVLFEEIPYGGISVSEKSDIIVRITSASANNLDVIAGYDLIIIKN